VKRIFDIISLVTKSKEFNVYGFLFIDLSKCA
jgi:hypothetical protein